MLNWIKLEPGCEMPDYDEFVLWRTETGNYHVDCIDKDDDDWWNGVPNDDPLMSWPKCTHYAHIPAPEEELPREAEKYFNDEQGMMWDEIWESLDFYPGDVTLKKILDGYIISRK